MVSGAQGLDARPDRYSQIRMILVLRSVCSDRRPMKLPLFQIDAFTSKLFAGNPAAVVILDGWLEDRLLAAIAAENNLSETAFVVPHRKLVPLRWFTPQIEVDLCGHATLAAAHVLLNNYFPSLDTVKFSTASGELLVTRDGNLLRMDFPARPPRPIAVTDALTAALGAQPQRVLASRDLLAIFDSEDEVRALQPDFERVAALDTFAIIASAPGKQVDFVSRFFAPRAGILEDPVTGSAHCTLVPYWSAKLGKTSLTARQVSPRGGELLCEMAGERVLISGGTVEYLRGEINVPN
jgi:PhzF family phenazine biosynthesis protein